MNAATLSSDCASLRAAGRPAMLTKTRWLLLKRRENMSADERGRPSEQTAAALEGAMRTAGVAVSSLARCYVKEETCPFPDTRPLRPCAARCGSRVGREAGIVPCVRRAKRGFARSFFGSSETMVTAIFDAILAAVAER